MQVEVELADELAGALDAQHFDRRVPHGGGVVAELHGVERFDDAEQAVEHARFGEVLAHLVFGEGVACLAQLFAGVAHVPGLQFGDAEVFGGKGFELGQIAFGVGLGLGAEFAQEVEHLFGRFGHLGHQ